MKHLEIRHATRYSFPVPVALGSHVLLLRPREGHDLHITSSALKVVPEAKVTWRRDLYDNVLCVAGFGRLETAELAIESRVQVELYDTMPLDFLVEDHALHYPFDYRWEERVGLSPYLEPSYQDDGRMAQWLEPYRRSPQGTQTFSVLDRINKDIHTGFGYEVREEEGVLPPAETLQRGAGSCRDLAALFLESCRRLGIAARFVSGYVHGPATEAGGAATHAWSEVYLPGAGWKGFDPTTAAVVGPDHIPVAVHRDPEAVPPVAGSFTGPAGLSPVLIVDVQINQTGESR
jgi:transglutaminase-like putative cysteine protease